MKTQSSVKDLLVNVRKHVEQQGFVKGTRYLYIAGINDLRRHFERKQQNEYSREIAWERVKETQKTVRR